MAPDLLLADVVGMGFEVEMEQNTEGAGEPRAALQAVGYFGDLDKQTMPRMLSARPGRT